MPQPHKQKSPQKKMKLKEEYNSQIMENELPQKKETRRKNAVRMAHSKALVAIMTQNKILKAPTTEVARSASRKINRECSRQTKEDETSQEKDMRTRDALRMTKKRALETSEQQEERRTKHRIKVAQWRAKKKKEKSMTEQPKLASQDCPHLKNIIVQKVEKNESTNVDTLAEVNNPEESKTIQTIPKSTKNVKSSTIISKKKSPKDVKSNKTVSRNRSSENAKSSTTIIKKRSSERVKSINSKLVKPIPNSNINKSSSANTSTNNSKNISLESPENVKSNGSLNCQKKIDSNNLPIYKKNKPNLADTLTRTNNLKKCNIVRITPKHSQNMNCTTINIPKSPLNSFHKDNRKRLIIFRSISGNTGPAQNSKPTETRQSISEVERVSECSNFNPGHTTLSDMIKMDSLQQVSTNVLPVYVPKSPPNFPGKFPFQHQACTECGDVFLSSSSLDFHLERRSVHIKLPCSACGMMKFFYNRCTLLRHIRAHKDKGEESVIDNVQVTPIPIELMKTMIEKTPNSFLEGSEDNRTMPPTDMIECLMDKINGDDQALEPQENIHESSTYVEKIKCLECGEDFASQDQREQHMASSNAIPSKALKCSVCTVICPSKCSLAAHQKIHSQASPYVCPECGDSPNPHWLAFQKHVNYECYHKTRVTRHYCPICEDTFDSPGKFYHHMAEHTENFFRCKVCQRSYASFSAFNCHIGTHHPTKDEVSYEIVHKCFYCQAVFLGKEHMFSHRTSHLFEESMFKFFFKCMHCKKIINDKPALLNHVNTVHPNTVKELGKRRNYHTKVLIQENSEESTNSQQVPNEATFCEFMLKLADRRNENTAVKHVMSKRVPKSIVGVNRKIQCLLCQTSLCNPVEYSRHFSEAHAHMAQHCAYCSMYIKTYELMTSHGKDHLENYTSICLLCNNKDLQSSKCLDLHLKGHVSELNMFTMCPICGALLTSRKMAHEHLRKEHLLRSTSIPLSNSNAVSCILCDASFVDKSLLYLHLKTKHKVTNLKILGESTSHENVVESMDTKTVEEDKPVDEM